MTAHTGPGDVPAVSGDPIHGGPGLEAHGSPNPRVGVADVDGRVDVAEVVLHGERLQVARERVAVQRVRVSKRIVTTTRTLQVPVRVEQLVLTREPLTAQESEAYLGERGGAVGAEVVLVLHEEVPEVSLRVVPVERVLVRTQSVQGEQRISADLHTETADVTTRVSTGPQRSENSVP